jgi:anti-anti-sigma regulatory factor
MDFYNGRFFMTDQSEIRASVQAQDSTVVAIGELDLTNADILCRALDQAVLREFGVTVDLQRTVFIDTAVLACLARYGKMLMNTARRLNVLVSEGTHPHYVLKTVGFSKLMDIEVISAKPGIVAASQ